MANILYVSAIGSLMNTIVCMWPNIGHAVRVLSRFM